MTGFSPDPTIITSIAKAQYCNQHKEYTNDCLFTLFIFKVRLSYVVQFVIVKFDKYSQKGKLKMYLSWNKYFSIFEQLSPKRLNGQSYF